jgi:S1-C subfamily serine protease
MMAAVPRRALGPLAALAALALTMLAAGCGSSGAKTVERTKVEVVDRGGKTGFDPAAIYKQTSNGVVTITSLFGSSSGSSPLGGPGEAGQGSGFILDDHGFIATNAHVVTEGRGSNIKKAPELFAEFADGNQVSARIIGFDPNSDVALIKVDPKGLRLVPVKLGQSARVVVGEPVAAIGSPFGEEQSLTVGVVSAINRTIDALTDFQIGDAIQTDAAINRGNSGGPLMNARGEVIGINSQIRSSGGGSEGIGFAVPIDAVKRSLAQLRETGEAHYGYIGVSSQPLYPQLAKRLKLPVEQGALVAEVVKGGPAQKAGIKGGGKEIRFQATLVRPGGDVITQVNGRSITRERDLSDLISRYRPGDTVTLAVYRGGRRLDVHVKLGERPSNIPK